MKAAQFNTYGGPEVIEINNDAVKPSLLDGHVLVEVTASGINPVESAIRSGYMQQMLPLTFPANTGGDFSGVITEIGTGVTNFKVGDEVYGVANHFKGGSGAVAEYASASATTVGLKPKTVDHIQAASLPLVGTSAVQALEEHIKLQNGQKILIQGGAGGVGSIAIQLAKSIGAYVATTVSTDDVEFAKTLGADEVFDYKSQDVSTLLNGYDAVFDTVGGETMNKSISVLKKDGIIVSMAGQPDEELARQAGVSAISQVTQASTEQLTRLAELVDSGKIKPIVDKVFTIDQTKEAYELLEQGSPRGKVVITIS